MIIFIGSFAQYMSLISIIIIIITTIIIIIIITIIIIIIIIPIIINVNVIIPSLCCALWLTT